MSHSRLVMLRLLRWILRWRAQPLQLPAGPLLVIAPHPDDETLGCGGLIIRERLAGRLVRIVFLTDGSQSHRDHPSLTPTALAKLRKAEAVAAAYVTAGFCLENRDDIGEWSTLVLHKLSNREQCLHKADVDA